MSLSTQLSGNLASEDTHCQEPHQVKMGRHHSVACRCVGADMQAVASQVSTQLLHNAPGTVGLVGCSLAGQSPIVGQAQPLRRTGPNRVAVETARRAALLLIRDPVARTLQSNMVQTGDGKPADVEVLAEWEPAELLTE
mmetsp:Transcript_48023/g.112152  ORF Transcript_48023/g.112152 Transcript_48023/m.112152 type:complete len:139 (+) Transcript_48023:38-454(+)